MTATFENGDLCARLQWIQGGTLTATFRNGEEAHHSTHEFRFPATPERIEEMTDFARRLVAQDFAWEHVNWSSFWRQSQL